jgi:hypothetical protein
VDIMSKMRGVDPFPQLWRRRTTIELPDDTKSDLLSLPDLVQAKKTQRDKDWPMIRRLVEAHYFQNRDQPTAAQIKFWFRELRTPLLLIEAAKSHAAHCRKLLTERPLLTKAMLGQTDELERAVREEESDERERDKRYWLPLRKELETLRHKK